MCAVGSSERYAAWLFFYKAAFQAARASACLQYRLCASAAAKALACCVRSQGITASDLLYEHFHTQHSIGCGRRAICWKGCVFFFAVVDHRLWLWS